MTVRTVAPRTVAARVRRQAEIRLPRVFFVSGKSSDPRSIERCAGERTGRQSQSVQAIVPPLPLVPQARITSPLSFHWVVYASPPEVTDV